VAPQAEQAYTVDVLAMAPNIGRAARPVKRRQAGCDGEAGPRPES